MSESRDPARLLEAPDAALAELEPLLREARTQGPSADQAARMRAALGLAEGAAHGDAPARASTTRADHRAPVPTWLKLSLLVALGIGAMFLTQRAPRSGRPVRGVGTRPSATVPVLDAQPKPRAADLPSAEPARVVEPEPGRRAASTPARRGRVAVAVQAADGDPAAELALLKRAKAHARSAPERALALLAEHEQRFANGMFVQEREVIAIEALLAGGDRDAAEQRAARFLERFADSAHARRVRALLGEPAATLFDAKSGAPPHSSR